MLCKSEIGARKELYTHLTCFKQWECLYLAVLQKLAHACGCVGMGCAWVMKHCLTLSGGGLCYADLPARALSDSE